MAVISVFPELALTTFFPRWYRRTRPSWTRSSSARSVARDRTALRGGEGQRHRLLSRLSELTPEGRGFNTAILVDKAGAITGKYRKIHLPGHAEHEPGAPFSLEKRYFEVGDLGWGVWRTMGGLMGMAICNDRRWPETYRVWGSRMSRWC
jgi:predicted amidohydrolase